MSDVRSRVLTMSPVQFHVREAAGLPSIPTSTSGAPRGRLRPGLRWHTGHYTGVEESAIWFSGGDGVFDSIEDVFRYMRRMEEVARASGKPYEYNTVIPVMSDNSSHVIAYADEYQAAHSAGENADAHGTQFAVGVGQPLNGGAIRAARWWHAVLLASGRLAPAATRWTPHREMPGANTACWGDAIEAVRHELDRPWSAADEAPAEAPTNPNPTPEDDTMFRYKDNRYANEWLMPSGATYGGHLPEVAALPLRTGQHDQMLAGLCLRAWPNAIAAPASANAVKPEHIIAAYETAGLLVR